MQLASAHLLACIAVRFAVRLQGVGLQCRRGFRPRGRLTFFAGAKKVSQESTWKTGMRRAVVAVDTGRCAPAGAAHGLAQPALDRATCASAAVHGPTRWVTCIKRFSPLRSSCRIAALATERLMACTASAAMRGGPPAGECRHSGAQTGWQGVNSNLIPGPVERLLRETVLATGWSAATGVYGHHRTPRCIPRCFLGLLSLHQQRK